MYPSPDPSATAPQPKGRWWCPLLPRNSDMHIVVGKALQLPVLAAPTKEQVNEWHAKYMAEVTALFDRHKGNYGAAGKELEIW